MQPSSPDMAAVLARIPLFSDLSPGDLASLSLRARQRSYEPEEVIFSQDDPGHTFFAIVSGIVRIVLPSLEGQEAVLVLLGAGEFFGELSLFDGQPRSASAIAMGPTRTVAIQRESFLPFLQEHPQAALAILTVLSRRLRRTDELIADAIFLDVPTRIAKKLLELADTFGEEVEQGVEIAIRLRQQDMANMVGATRESVNRFLGLLESQGLIHMEKQRITLLRPEELRRSAY